MPSRKQRRPSTTARPSRRHPPRRSLPPTGPPRKTPNRARPVGGHVVSVTANKNQISGTEKPPGKTGRFFLLSFRGALSANPESHHLDFQSLRHDPVRAAPVFGYPPSQL